MSRARSFKLSKVGLLSLCVAAASSAIAQDSNEEAIQQEEVIVTGYRGSLLTSTNAKRNSVGFSDEVFADDIGKMPSQNLAESLSRIPGVKISREVTGEGQQITVRGLGSSFTKVVMNGNSIAVASDGSMGSGARGRHVDLDMFPPELFSSLAVNKTTTAQQVEGGVSGYVNMRTLRASDLGEGANFRFGLEGAYNEMSSSTSPRISFIGGFSDDTWGIMGGIVHRQSETRVDGYETVGNYQSGCAVEWRAPDDYGCVDGSTGWNVFNYATYATADYAAANAGVSTGDPIDLNAISGLSDSELDNFGLPYIARPMYTFGDRDTTSFIGSVEFNPNDDLSFNLDLLVSNADRNFLRNELMHIYRRNGLQYGLEWIPQDIQLSEDNVIQSGTFWNNRPWVGSRDYQEELSYTSVMPSMSWNIRDDFTMDISASKTSSEFDRDEPYLLYYAPAGQLTFAYDGDFPTVQHTADLANVGPGWTWGAGPSDIPGAGSEVQAGSFRFQRNKRETETTSFNIDFTLGDEPDVNGLKFGIAMDENDSDMTGFNSDGFADLFTGTTLETDFSSVLVNSPVQDLGNSISGYNGINGIVSADWNAVKNAINYNAFQPTTDGTGDQFGATVGDINEEVLAFYLEANTETEIAGRTLRTNMGIRMVDTEQTVTVADDDEATPNVVETASTVADYTRILPSMSVVYDLREDIKLRASASRSLTRANPSSMFPTVAWNGSGIDEVAAGNPFLSPFESTNMDIGGEWYFSDLGYVGFTYYEKDITGFTKEDNVQVQFLELEGYGVDISEDAISDTQNDAIQACGGRASDQCVTNVVTDVNIDGVTKLYGMELIWVQPLDMWVEGLGFNTSMNKIDQNASDPDGEIFGLADSFNFTAYYENEMFQTRLTYTRTDEAEAGGGWSPLMAPERTQVDFSASYNLPVLEDYNLTLTFDAYNLTNEPLHTVFESDANTFNIFYPGATYTFGIRGSF